MESRTKQRLASWVPRMIFDMERACRLVDVGCIVFVSCVDLIQGESSLVAPDVRRYERGAVASRPFIG